MRAQEVVEIQHLLFHFIIEQRRQQCAGHFSTKCHIRVGQPIVSLRFHIHIEEEEYSKEYSTELARSELPTVSVNFPKFPTSSAK